jgi:hypothetical protein
VWWSQTVCTWPAPQNLFYPWLTSISLFPTQDNEVFFATARPYLTDIVLRTLNLLVLKRSSYFFLRMRAVRSQWITLHTPPFVSYKSKIFELAAPTRTRSKSIDSHLETSLRCPPADLNIQETRFWAALSTTYDQRSPFSWLENLITLYAQPQQWLRCFEVINDATVQYNPAKLHSHVCAETYSWPLYMGQ